MNPQQNQNLPFKHSPLADGYKMAASTHEMPFHHHVIAGATAGLIEVLIMYPLDVVKTRLQLQKVILFNQISSIH